MSLIKCPECGKEISDKADRCPSCGCPKILYEQSVPRELPPEKRPKMFQCYNCGKPLPVGIDKCIYCDYEYDKYYAERLIAESETGLFGTKGIICPYCNYDKVKIENDIPIHKKIRDILLIGGIMPTTKADYRKGMIYCCKKCGKKWK